LQPDHVDAVLVPDHPDPHADLADRVIEILDQLGGIESVFTLLIGRPK